MLALAERAHCDGDVDDRRLTVLAHVGDRVVERLGEFNHGLAFADLIQYCLCWPDLHVLLLRVVVVVERLGEFNHGLAFADLIQYCLCWPDLHVLLLRVVVALLSAASMSRTRPPCSGSRALPFPRSCAW